MKAILSYLILLTISCNNISYSNREIQKLDKEVLYTIDKDLQTDSLIFAVANDMQNAFSLEPIETSQTTYEIRIYFASLWHEKFFITRLHGDSISSELYNCKTDRRNDSLFMKFENRISSVVKTTHMLDTDLLPSFEQNLPKDSVVTLDSGYSYFILTKTGNKIKRILVNDKYLEASYSVSANRIKKFIQSVADQYNFSFYDSWEKVEELAFKH